MTDQELERFNEGRLLKSQIQKQKSISEMEDVRISVKVICPITPKGDFSITPTPAQVDSFVKRMKEDAQNELINLQSQYDKL